MEIDFNHNDPFSGRHWAGRNPNFTTKPPYPEDNRPDYKVYISLTDEDGSSGLSSDAERPPGWYWWDAMHLPAKGPFPTAKAAFDDAKLSYPELVVRGD